MTERGLGDDSTITDLPWAAAFDPAANIRALGAVQSQGLRAATEIVNRFVQLADEGLNRKAADSNGAQKADRPTAPQTSAPGVDQVLATWDSIVGRLTGSLTTPGPIPTGAATLDLAGSGATSGIHVEANGAGSLSTEVWLHNGGATQPR